MASLQQRLSEQFYDWERRGRGWQVFEQPVHPEPPFLPFPGHYLPDEEPRDDGVRSTILSSFVQKLSRSLSTKVEPPKLDSEPDDQLEPEPLFRDSLIELQTALPAKLDIGSDAFGHFLAGLAHCREPISFELLGIPERVSVQFAADSADAPLLRRQLQAHFPEASFLQSKGTLETAWNACPESEMLVVEFGLEREFMFPLATGKLDLFVGLVGALDELAKGDAGIFQVLFQPVRGRWGDSIVRSVSHDDGKPFFLNMPELTKAAITKASQALYAVVVRIATMGETFDRALEIARELAGPLQTLASVQGNALVPLHNQTYPFEEHINDMLRRQSRRSGMVLNREELIGLVHLPSSSVRSPVLRRDAGKTKAAPRNALQSSGILLGNNEHAGKAIPVRLSNEQRVQHMHVIGVPGTGKSTLLFNLIRQDIVNGEGVGVLDPHGDLIDQILEIIPEDRIDDVVLVDPSDEEYSIGCNILSAHSDLEKTLLASDLVSVFQRLSSSWGDQLGSVLKNAILAFLESSEGGTLSELRRFLLEPAFRDRFLKTVGDPDIVYYWKKGFTQLTGNKSIGPVITRLNDFLAPKPIRYMVSQKVNRLDFANILDTGKIFLAKLSQGQIGDENSFLLGSLFVGKIQQLVMARQVQKAAVRRDFFLYIDEFHNFITPSMAQILTGARKYRLGLVLAHQELRQLERDRNVASAVLANPYTRVIFRVGDADARTLENGLSFFEARGLQNLERGSAICRVEKSDWDFNLSVPPPETRDSGTGEGIRQAVITASRSKYAVQRAELQAAERALLESLDTQPEPTKPTLPPARPSPIHRAPEQKPVEEVTVSAKPPVVREPPPPRDMGRGGAQHQAIQKRLKQAAESLGFKATIEQQVLDGKGSVDLLLVRGDQVIACEIAITTTIDHEVGNVLKCLTAGFKSIAVIASDQDRLQKIRIAVAAGIGAELAGFVGYFEPDTFITHLKGLSAPPISHSQTPKTRRGYVVKRSASKLAADELAGRESDAIRSIAEAMKRALK